MMDRTAPASPATATAAVNRSAASELFTDIPLQHRPHACPFAGCTRRFKRKYTLKDHLKSHTGEKPFVCPVRTCRKTFTTSGNLSRHKRLHPWLDAPLECLVDGCGCKFANEQKLERHMMTHFGESSAVRCEIGMCGKVFSTAGNLRRHIKQNHDESECSDGSEGGGGGSSSANGTPKNSPSRPPQLNGLAPQLAPLSAFPVAAFPMQHTGHRGHGGHVEQHAPSAFAPAQLIHPSEYTAAMANQRHHLPSSDDDLLEALSCLFDRDEEEEEKHYEL